MNAAHALVSICIPSYNYAQYIAGTIDSALDQDYPNFEIIVSDNASTDDTLTVLERYCDDARVRIFHHQANQGIACNVNFAVEQARGEYVVVVGADDEMLPSFLRSCMARMADERDPVDLVYAGAIICNEDLRPVSVQRLVSQIDIPYSHRNEFAGLLQIVYVLFTATLFKKSLFSEIGYLNAKTKIAFDWEFLLALAAADKRFASIPDPVINVRYHKNQASSSQGYFFSGHAFDECLSILESMVIEQHAWRFHGYEHRIMERLNWYDEMFRDSASLETLERYEAMIARLKKFAAAAAPVWPTHVPRVSVVMVCDGDPGLLDRALDSLAAQAYTNWEAVIVQYQGTTLEPQVRRRGDSQKFRFSFGSSSQAIARVHGMDLARGEIIAHQHSGAVFGVGHLAHAVASLDKQKPPIVVTEAVDSIDSVTQMNYGPYRQARKVVSGIRDAAGIQSRLHVAPVVDISCVVHRRTILDTVGSISIDQPILGEWEFILRAALSLGLTIAPAPTVELHHNVGAEPIERAYSFLNGIDEIYQRFPALDGNVAQQRKLFRAEMTTCLADQANKVSTVDGMFELVTSLTGLLGVSALAVPA